VYAVAKVTLREPFKGSSAASVLSLYRQQKKMQLLGYVALGTMDLHHEHFTML
jgi:hypothetical protein